MPIEKGTIQTVIGTGEAGYSGDGGPAVNATLREPFMCAFDRQGNLFLSEARNHTVRRIDQNTGVITTVAGTGEPVIPATAARRPKPGLTNLTH